MMYMSKLAGKKINISLTPNEDIPKYSAMPPQTPNKALSADDFLSLFCIAIPLFVNYKKHSLLEHTYPCSSIRMKYRSSIFYK